MKQQVISVVGAGGKTTLIHRLQAQFAAEGKRVLILTTTHMWKEPGMLLYRTGDDACAFLRRAKEQLSEDGFCMAGAQAAHPDKCTILPEGLLTQIRKTADVVLIEADGSRQMPLKVPNETEPVIPADTTQVLVVMGKEGIGRRAGEVIHRLELAKEYLHLEEDTPVTIEHVRALFALYQNRLQKQSPGIPVRCFLAETKEGTRRYEEV